jgi:hypothetical protein
MIFHTFHSSKFTQNFIFALYIFKRLLNFIINKCEFCFLFFYDQKISNNKNNLCFKDYKIKNKNEIIIVGNNHKLDINLLQSKIKLNKYCIFALNYFFLSNLSKKVRVDYYIIIHRPSEYPLNKKKFQKNLSKYIKKNPSTLFFFTFEWYSILYEHKNIKFIKMSALQLKDYKIEKLSDDRIFPSVSNILIGAVLIAIKMKFKKVIIMGYDILFHFNTDYKYFFNYKRNIREKIKANFNYFDLGCFRIAELMLQEWLKLLDLSKNKGVKIYKNSSDTNLPVIKDISW